MFINNPQ